MGMWGWVSIVEVSKLPTQKASWGPRLCLESAGGAGGRIGGSPLVTALLLQFCLTWFSCGEGRGGGPGDKKEGKRRGGLPSFFEGKQICVPTAAPPCSRCVIRGQSLSLSEPQFGPPWVILEIRQDTIWKMLGQKLTPLPPLPSPASLMKREKHQPLAGHRGD